MRSGAYRAETPSSRSRPARHFPAVEIAGERLIDGGVANNAPISHALELGAERVYVLPTGDICALAKPPRGALEVLLHATTLLVMRRLVVEIELLREEAELIVMPPPCPLDVPATDFSQADELIEQAHREGSEFLDNAPSDTTYVPISERTDDRHQGYLPASMARRRQTTIRPPKPKSRHGKPWGGARQSSATYGVTNAALGRS